MLAGCVVLESAGVLLAAGCVESVVAGAASAAGVAAAGGGRASGLPGVMVSTAAVFPMLELGAAPTFGCKLNPMVSSPDSLAGVMVGAPFRAAVETSGLVFSTLIVRFTMPGRLIDCSLCIRASAVGSGGGTGTPNLTSFAFASPARCESG